MTDRGPNAEPTDKGRPFLMPSFQPRLVKLETDSAKGTFKVTNVILLKDSLGKPQTGLPPGSDESPIDLKGKKLAPDLMGIDGESLAVDDEGNFWLGEEYLPSILKYDKTGKLLKRFIPAQSLSKKDLQKLQKKYGKNVIAESLPEAFRHRKPNRGFEGLTYLNGKIYALLQSPLDLEADKNANTIRMLEFDTKTEKTTGEYIYPLTREKVDKIGDLSVQPGTQNVCAIEQNGKVGPTSQHLITCFNLSTPALKPTLLVALQEIGYDFAEKVEGLTFISEKTLAVVNDNDFGVTGSGAQLDPQKVPVLGIIDLK